MKTNFNAADAKDFSYNYNDGVSSYVADMQLHMTLQAKKLLPTLSTQGSAMEDLLREAQEVAEKLASRQRS